VTHHDHDHDRSPAHSDGGLGHHHHHHHGHGHGPGQAPRQIVRAIIITVIFMVIEFVGGWISNSLALISDAAHMLTDVGALFLSLFAIWLAKRPAPGKMSFGWHRVEILGALLSGLLIWVIAGFLVYEAVLRLQAPPEVQGLTVLVVAAIGLAANLLSMRMLHSSQHENMNVRAAYLHMIADALGSVGAVVAGAVLWLTDWRPIDPIITVLFSGLMLVSSWSLVKEALAVLMESTPSHLDQDQVQRDLESLAGVQEVHDLHIWTVSSGRLALSVHIIAREAQDVVLSKANDVLKLRYNIVHTTIQIEHPDKFNSERCYDCAPAAAKR
jgi:cobalt-zinc-cadmium efflux system protein